MKRIFSLLAVLLFVAGCGGGGENQTEESTHISNPQQEQLEVPFTVQTPESTQTQESSQEVVQTPESTQTQEIIQTPEVTSTQEIIQTPEVVQTQEITQTQEVVEIVEIEVGMSWVNKNPIVGMINPGNKEDWYAVELEARHLYQIDIRGEDSWDYFAGYPDEDFTRDHAPNEELTLRDPEIAGIYDSEFNYIQGTYDDYSGWGLDARTIFSATRCDNPHYILVRLKSWDNVGGTYDVSVTELGAGASTVSEPEGEDFLGNRNTRGRAAVGESVTGALIYTQDGMPLLDTLSFYETYYTATTDTFSFVDPNTGVYDFSQGFRTDHDYFSICLKGGVRYRITIEEPNDNSVTYTTRPKDTYIAIRNSDGAPARSGASRTGFNFRPQADGEFYLQVFSLEEYPDGNQMDDLEGHVDSLEHPADYYVITVSIHQNQ